MLGQGGFGRVYEAAEITTGRRVAVKILDNQKVGLLGRLRFQREFALLQKLDHPVLAQVYAYGEVDDHPYFTMELIRGQSLDVYFAEQDPEARLGSAAPIFASLLSALEYLHARGILHRDLKPQNVLIQADGQPRLLDFGTARESDQAGLTQTGSVLGTPRYLAPEQIRGEELDERVDLYALGVMLWECLSARPLYAGLDSAAIYYKILNDRPPELPEGIPPAVGRLLSGLLAKDRTRRLSSAAGVRQLWGELFPELSRQSEPSKPASVFSTPLVGRQKELAFLAERLVEGNGLVLLEGASGVGKSRLLQELKRLARQDGWHCTQLTCIEDDLPYRPLVEALRPCLEAGVSQPHRPALAQLFPELGSYAHEPASKLQLLEGLRLLVQSRPKHLLIVEEIQLADSGTLEFLRFLASSQDNARLVIVLSGNLGSGADRWVRLGARSLQLEPLALPEAKELVRLASGAPIPGERMDELWQETRGNPLFLLEILKTGGSVPHTIEEAIQRRFSGLSKAARELASLLKLCKPADFALLSEASDLSPQELLDALGELLAHRLIVYSDSLYDFECELVGRAVTGQVSANVHQRLARALEKRHAPAEVVAQHLLSAGQNREAAEHLVRAGHERCRSYNYTGALRFWQHAAELQPKLATEVAEPVADAKAMMADFSAALSDYGSLLEKEEGLAKIRLRRKLGLCYFRQGNLAAALSQFREAMAQLRMRYDSPVRRLRTAFRLVLQHPCAIDMPEAEAREYLACAPHLSRTLFFVRPAGWLVDHLTVTLIHQDLLQQLGDVELSEVQKHYLLGLRAQAFPAFGGAKAAVEHFRKAAKLLLALPDSSARLSVLRDLGCFLIINGDYANRSVLEEAERLGNERNDWSEFAVSCSLLSVVDCLTGRWTQARERIERLDQLVQLTANQADRLLCLSNAVLLYSLAGQPEDALAKKEELDRCRVDTPFFQLIAEISSLWTQIATAQWKSALAGARRIRKQCQAQGPVDVMRQGELFLLEGWAWVELQREKPYERKRLDKFLVAFLEMTRSLFGSLEPSALRLRARLCEVEDRRSQAIDFYERALLKAMDVENFMEQGHAQRGLARLKKRQQTPAKIGPYSIRERLGQGGMAEVFLAEREGQKFALKRLLASLPSSSDQKRFQREIQICRELEHPNLIRIFDAGEDYFVMEYLEGQSLRVILNERGPLSWQEAVDILVQAMDGVACAHRRGVAHRDLKPENIQVLPEGKVKVLDFGVARGDDFTVVTEAGMVMGSIYYIAPEQIQGSLALSCDQYSLGVVLYECLAGHPPFEGEGMMRIAECHLRSGPPALPDRVPVALQSAVMRMLRKNPEHRYADLEEVRRFLLDFRAGEVPASYSQPTEAFDQAALRS